MMPFRVCKVERVGAVVTPLAMPIEFLQVSNFPPLPYVPCLRRLASTSANVLWFHSCIPRGPLWSSLRGGYNIRYFPALRGLSCRPVCPSTLRGLRILRISVVAPPPCRFGFVRDLLLRDVFFLSGARSL